MEQADWAMAEETTRTTGFEPLGALWRVLGAPQVFMVLMGLLALALALSAFIPQIPPQARDDPQAWLAMQAGPFRQGGNVIRALGLFDLYHSFWFRFLLVLTGLSLFVRAVESVEVARQATGRKLWTIGTFRFWGKTPPRMGLPSSMSVEEVMAQLDKFLGEQGYWSTTVTDQVDSYRVAGRNRGVFWARSLGYVALVLALVGLAVAGDWGWQSDPWQPVAGELHAVGYGTPYVVRLDAFHINLVDDMRLQDYYSEVTWLEDNRELGTDVIGVGWPAKRQGVTLRQVGYLPIVRMRGQDAQGQRLVLETEADVLSVAGEAEFRFSSIDAQPLVLVSGHDLFLALSFDPMCADGKPALYIDRIGGGGADRQRLGVLYQSGPLFVDDLQLEVDLSFAPILRADSHPGVGLVVAGMVLVVAALLVSWLVPPHLVWIVVEQGTKSQTRIQILEFPGAGANRRLLNLKSRLQEVLVDDA
jgi:hypothetical protein